MMRFEVAEPSTLENRPNQVIIKESICIDLRTPYESVAILIKLKKEQDKPTLSHIILQDPESKAKTS